MATLRHDQGDPVAASPAATPTATPAQAQNTGGGNRQSTNPGYSSTQSTYGTTASGQQISSQVMQELKRIGFPGVDLSQPPPDWAITTAEDMLDASAAGDVFGPTLQGFTFPKQISVGEFSAIEALAHQFAANSNWKYMPTGKMIMDAYNQGITDKTQAFSMWFNKLGAQDKQAVPWLQAGQTQAQYQSAQDNMQTTLDKLTGSMDLSQIDPSIQAQAIRENWSSAKLESTLRQNLSAQSPWLAEKYGYDYKTWQTYKTDHRQDIIQRYGVDKANQDQLYLTAQDNPLGSQTGAHGGQINYESSTNQSTFYNKSSALDYGNASVR